MISVVDEHQRRFQNDFLVIPHLMVQLRSKTELFPRFPQKLNSQSLGAFYTNALLRLERRHQTGPWHSKPHNFWRWPFHKKLLMANLFVFIRWISLPYALWRETAIFNSYEPLNRQNRPFWPQNHTIFKSLFLFRIKELAQSVAGKLESLAWSLIVRTWNFLMGTSNPVK